MNVLWDHSSPMTAVEVVERLAARKAWSPRTVKTMLNRLIKKGALRFQADGKRYLYRPAMGREQCVRAAGRSFLSRVFGGAAGPMLVHFVSHTDLSSDEIGQLRQLLKDKQTQAPNPAKPAPKKKRR